MPVKGERVAPGVVDKHRLWTVNIALGRHPLNARGEEIKPQVSDETMAAFARTGAGETKIPEPLPGKVAPGEEQLIRSLHGYGLGHVHPSGSCENSTIDPGCDNDLFRVIAAMNGYTAPGDK